MRGEDAPAREQHHPATEPRGLPAVTDLASLTDEQLSDHLATLDASELVSEQRTIDLGASAQWYAGALEWPVFPLKPRGKKPLTQHGFKDATVDPDIIASWWMRWPDANLATPTGAREHGGCGLDVIDIDGHLGFASLSTIKHATCPPDCSATMYCPATGELPAIVARAFTPGDPTKTRAPGRHYYTPATGDGNASNYEPGLDYRGDGGYVVLPPSIGISGRRYSWLTQPTVPA